jgi:hypothetical protein
VSTTSASSRGEQASDAARMRTAIEVRMDDVAE